MKINKKLKKIALPEVEWYIDERLFVKQMLMKDAGIYVPKHKHDYDHCSMLATGSVRVWHDGKRVGDFKAPMPLTVKAGIFHTYMSLEPNTLVYCIHATKDGDVEVAGEQTEINPAILAEGV